MRLQKTMIMADGNSIHTEKWIAGLSQQGGNDIYLLSMNPNGVRASLLGNSAIKEVICVAPSRIATSGGNYPYLFNLFKIRKQIKFINPDVIISIYLSSYGLVASLLKGQRSLVHVVIGSDIMVTPAKSWYYKLATKYALKKADLIVSASNTCTDKIFSDYHISDRVLTQQYSVEDWVLNHSEQAQKYVFSSNRAWIENSNISYVLKLFNELRVGNLALIGDGSLRDEICQLANSNSAVRVLGQLAHVENIRVVAQSQFFFSLTTSDGASLSLMEAMAVGCIPIVSNIAANREWVEDGVNGFIIELNDFDGALIKLRKIVATPLEMLLAMRQKNRDIIQERGGMTKNMARFMSVLSTTQQRFGKN